MKRFILSVAVVAFTMVTFTSCKKDWTCNCTIASIETPTEISKAKKKDAQDACDALETSAKILDSNASCTLNSK